ncbi:MAG: hypothetical protein Fur0035_07650 [Anaerolineales bacterium]
MELTTIASPNTLGRLRPLNILRDLTGVADLVELCFAPTLDSEGRSFLEQMRRNAHDSRFLRWAPGVIDSVSLPLSGFVWEDQGKIVGNASLIPYRKDGRRITLIANVATHPDYRRRGIGRLLTESALRRARERSDEVWLQVRADNPSAIHIYQQLGFQERARRSTWLARPAEVENPPAPAALTLRPRRPADWEKQRAWLENANPQEINWFSPTPSAAAIGPQWWNSLYRIFNDMTLHQRAAEWENSLAGILTIQENYGSRRSLWLALPPQPREELVRALLMEARQNFGRAHSLSLEHPSGPADAGIASAGFSAIRTLIWMKAA